MNLHLEQMIRKKYQKKQKNYDSVPSKCNGRFDNFEIFGFCTFPTFLRDFYAVKLPIIIAVL